ncbi:MAG: hypothetical protein EOP34_05165 [Rickettsiales bacterium]|nr:MAG: hypothetical protein EOP34_05165 [Rickettsiales bacterium]
MTEHIKWYDIIPKEKKIMFKNFYRDISVLDYIRVCGFNMNAFNVFGINVECNLPYPDKNISS